MNAIARRPRLPKSGTTGLARFVSRSGERVFSHPVEIVQAAAVDDVLPTLRRVHALVSDGLIAAGYVAYEAAPAFDPALAAHPPAETPLAWFGLYEAVEERPRQSPMRTPGVPPPSWSPRISKQTYLDALRRVRDYIAAGDTYQVNYTYPLHAAFDGDPLDWFRQLCSAQRTDYSVYLDIGRFKVLSLSPELFFRLDGDRLVVRPMKGTAPRGLWYEDDCECARRLARSEKDRAENLMIVDLLRNDLGRIARIGSVRVGPLFEIERYETLWQMTSAISAKTDAGVPEIFAALFPSGSVTGAPKIRTMQIIRELEPYPRGVYCGAVGWWGPGRRAEFNVAIRTVTLDTRFGTATYSVGGGVTWDSAPLAEYDESRLKAVFVTHSRPEFDLLETLLWNGEFVFLDEHLDRLRKSAEYFGFDVDLTSVRKQLIKTSSKWPSAPLRVRLLVSRGGQVRIETSVPPITAHFRVALANAPVDQTNIFLYHKTTHRTVYDQAKAARPDLDDVLLWNSRGEVTESTMANVIVEKSGELLTPPISCGLLPGVMRARLLAEGRIREAIITKEGLSAADSIWLVNSVRGWVRAKLAN